MEKVVLGNLKEELQKDNLNLSERMLKDSLEDKMLFLETELDGLEKNDLSYFKILKNKKTNMEQML
ncbi:MAG: hypothetical protein MR938_02340 [Tenericutes bacterium]|nr:hypothetical protein [Mycoplasmatota bacterium]